MNMTQAIKHFKTALANNIFEIDKTSPIILEKQKLRDRCLNEFPAYRDFIGDQLGSYIDLPDNVSLNAGNLDHVAVNLHQYLKDNKKNPNAIHKIEPFLFGNELDGYGFDLSVKNPDQQFVILDAATDYIDNYFNTPKGLSPKDLKVATGNVELESDDLEDLGYFDKDYPVLLAIGVLNKAGKCKLVLPIAIDTKYDLRLTLPDTYQSDYHKYNIDLKLPQIDLPVSTLQTLLSKFDLLRFGSIYPVKIHGGRHNYHRYLRYYFPMKAEETRYLEDLTVTNKDLATCSYDYDYRYDHNYDQTSMVRDEFEGLAETVIYSYLNSLYMARRADGRVELRSLRTNKYLNKLQLISQSLAVLSMDIADLKYSISSQGSDDPIFASLQYWSFASDGLINISANVGQIMLDLPTDHQDPVVSDLPIKEKHAMNPIATDNGLNTLFNEFNHQADRKFFLTNEHLAAISSDFRTEVSCNYDKSNNKKRNKKR